MTTYWVIEPSWMGKLRTPLGKLFATPFQAETFIAHMSLSHSGYTYGVRPATWRERESRMFEPDPATGIAIYQRPVWEEEPWWVRVRSHFKDQFLHISFLDQTAVAFTEDETKGEADRQTMMRPGKYLQKFLGAGPDGTIAHGPLKDWAPQVTKHQIAFYADWHQRGARPPSDDVLAFTEDEHEIIRVYEEGPASCMMGKGWEFREHPVRVYAGGGLAMAYLTSVSGDVVARALCWPKNEAFGRVYPTPNNDTAQNHYDELMARLKAKGWTSITEDSTVFEGALLRQIPHRYGSYLMPYLDNEYGVREAYRDGKDWWVMTHDEEHQDNQSGVLANSEPDWTCECCEGGFSDDHDNHSVYRYWQGNSSHGYPRGEEMWCEDCRDSNTFYCEGSEEYYTDSADSIYCANGCTYERRWFEANDGYQCSHSDEYHFRDDDPPVVLATGALVYEDYVEEAAFRCRVTGLLWPRDLESDAVPGYHLGFDTLPVHPIEWECVLPEPPDDVTLAAWGVMLAGGTWPPALQGDLFIANPVEPPVVIDLAKSGLRYDPTLLDNHNRQFSL